MEMRHKEDENVYFLQKYSVIADSWSDFEK